MNEYKDFDGAERSILESLRGFSGKVSFFCKDLTSGREIAYHTDESLLAASVIKLPILAAVFRDIEDGKLSADDIYVLKEEDKKPSCGCLNRMHAGLALTVSDLCNLMIILSDNSASNILIRMVGMERINAYMDALSYTDCRVNRELFDMEAAKAGRQNYVSVRNIADMLEKIYRGELISQAASREMLTILTEQRLNGKMPFFFEEKVLIAHKTGEDEGITHDVGIVLSQNPFLICFMGNEVSVPAYERFMQETTYAVYNLLSK